MQNSQNRHWTILCDPKTCLRGSLRATKCLDASYSVPRHHTNTMGPYFGVPRAPWVRQNPTCKIFTVFQPNLPYKTAKTSTGPSCATPKPVCRGPCGPPSAWMPPTVSQDTIQSVWDPNLGSPGYPGSSKIKNILNFTHFGFPEKNTSQNASQNPKNTKKSKFCKNEAVSSNISDYAHMANLLRLTNELGSF